MSPVLFCVPPAFNVLKRSSTADDPMSLALNDITVTGLLRSTNDVMCDDDCARFAEEPLMKPRKDDDKLLKL